MKPSEDVVDLIHAEQITQHDQGREELARIDEKIQALTYRRNALARELGLDVEVASTDDLDLDNTTAHSNFLDDGFDVFAGSPTQEVIKNLDVADEQFEERFALFAANDEKGDHKARRWFDSV